MFLDPKPNLMAAQAPRVGVAGQALPLQLQDKAHHEEAKAIPDEFVIYVLDNTNSSIPTSAGFGSDYLLTVGSDANNPDVQVFAGDKTRD